MGNVEKRRSNTIMKSEISEECKKEYFRSINRGFTDEIKKINSTLHSADVINSTTDSWISYLIDEFNKYSKYERFNNKHINPIIVYLKNSKEINELKYVHNLSVYLTRELEGSIFNQEKSNFYFNLGFIIEKYYSEKETDSETESLNKDKMLWKGSEYIFNDIEDASHPLNCFIKYMTYVIADVYEKEYQKISNNIDRSISYYNSISTEESVNKKARFSYDDILNNTYSSSENTKENLNISNSNFNNQEYKNYSDFYKIVFSEIAIFSSYIANAMIRFYSIKNSMSNKLFEIYCEKVKDLLVRRDLYSLIFKIKNKLNDKRKEQYNECLLKYFNVKTHYMCINPFFSQDKKFRNIFKNYCKNKNKITNKNKSEINLKVLEFSKSISLFREIVDNHSIMKKLDILYKLRDSILNEIEEFWKDIPIKQKYKSVDADNLLSIFIYLTIKSQIHSLIIDLEIINDFTDRNFKLSRKGYFFCLFKSSIDYMIGSLSLPQIDSNIMEYNKMLIKEITNFEQNPEFFLDL